MYSIWFPSPLFCFDCFAAILPWSPPIGTKGNEGQYLSAVLLFAWGVLPHSLLGLQPAERLIRVAQTFFASCLRLGFRHICLLGPLRRIRCLDFMQRGKRDYKGQHSPAERMIRVAQTFLASCIRRGSVTCVLWLLFVVLPWSPLNGGAEGIEGHKYKGQHLPAETLICVAQTFCASCVRLGCPLHCVCFCCFVAVPSWSPPSKAKGNEGQHPEAMPLDLLVGNL